MVSIEDLEGIILTEALEGPTLESPPLPETSLEEKKLPPINYTLELIKYPDGSYEWVE